MGVWDAAVTVAIKKMKQEMYRDTVFLLAATRSVCDGDMEYSKNMGSRFSRIPRWLSDKTVKTQFRWFRHYVAGGFAGIYLAGDCPIDIVSFSQEQSFSP